MPYTTAAVGRGNTATSIQNSDTGSNWRNDHCPRHDPTLPQGRYRQALWWGRNTKEEIAGKTEKRQGEDEAVRKRQHSTEGVCIGAAR